MLTVSTFRTRNFISLLMAGCFVIMAVTGIILFVVPPGRIANWSDWTLFYLHKEEWAAIHIVTSIAFVTCGIYHVVLNWKVLVHYITTRMRTNREDRKIGVEGFFVLALMALIVTGTLTRSVPFNWILDGHETIKNSWSGDNLSQPNHNLNQALPAPTFKGSGIGQMTVRDIAAQHKIEVAVVMGRLEAVGIKATAETRLRELANDDFRPYQLLDIILGKTGN